MPNYTTNLNLVKPLITENYDISKVTNDNADILDSAVKNLDDNKQEILVSGTNIKTINSNNLLGSGDIEVQEVLESGTNIKSINGSSILASGDLSLSTKSTETTATLSSANWLGASSPYTYDLTVSGVTTTSNQELLPSLTITSTELQALQSANIIDAGQTTNTINLKAFVTKPTIDIPLRVILRGDK